MKRHLTFKEYIETKNRLKEASSNRPIVKVRYEVKRYCKIPLKARISDDDKVYFSMKPKNFVEVLWEYETLDSPIAKEIKLISEDGQIMYFVWSNARIKKWIDNSCHQIHI